MRGGLHHLDHEGRAPAGQVVGGADAGEQPIDDADVGGPRRHERAHLGQHRDQRVLAQEGGLAGHVRAGDQPEARLRHLVEAGRRVGRAAHQHAVVLDEGAGLGGLQCLLDDRMPPAADLEGDAVVEPGRM